jgi:AraC-like DNA-binding protein
MDPLSDVLMLLEPRSAVSGGLDAGGAWSVVFPRSEGLKCYVVVEGACWLSMEGVHDPVQMEAGECFLFSQGRSFRLASDLAVRPMSVKAMWASRHGDVFVCNGGGDFFLAGSHFDFGGQHGVTLLDALPPVVRIRNEAGRDVLQWSIERMRQELRERQPGAALMVQYLVHMMLVQALRQYLQDRTVAGASWLLALGDKQIGAALAAMHEAPARRWTLRQLAERAGMSRSIFALKFREEVGATPMAYLTRWRMVLAADKLTSSRDSISTVAAALGYESESAFSLAFKKVMGCSPRRFALRRRGAPAKPQGGEP